MLLSSKFAHTRSWTLGYHHLRQILHFSGRQAVASYLILKASDKKEFTCCSMSTKAKTALDEMSKTGEFKRTDAGFRNWIKEGGEFPPEGGRYHLYISLACPWASRCLAVMYLKGLQDAIGLSVTHPTWLRSRPDNPDDQHCGWVMKKPDDPPIANVNGFGSFDCAGCIPDTVNGVNFIRDLYEKSNDTTGKYSVPVLWDKKSGVIVNNESSEIMVMFNSEFNKFAKHPELDLYPQELMQQIDGVNEWVYPTINNGVYRCGFATKQEPYNVAYKELFDSLDRCESILSHQPFIAGDVLTAADIRLFVTLIRFDPVYVVYFKTNKKFIREYPHLKKYVQKLFNWPGIKESVNIEHIKTHYYTSHPKLNYYAIIPQGVDPWWEEKPDA